MKDKKALAKTKQNETPRIRKPFGLTGDDLARALRRMAVEVIHALYKEYEHAYKTGNYITKDKITAELIYNDSAIEALTNAAITGDMLLPLFEKKCIQQYGAFKKAKC